MTKTFAEDRRIVSVCGHFGEFIQGRLGVNEPIVLITVPSNQYKVKVIYTKGDFKVEQKGTHFYTSSVIFDLVKTAKLSIHGNIHINLSMPEACGVGSSTATRVAVLRAIKPNISMKTLVDACIKHEGASDPIMYKVPERLLWAPRTGKVLKRMPKVPKISCIGGFYGSPLKTDPFDSKFPLIGDLIDLWQLPKKTDKFLAELCSESSERTIKYRKICDDPTKLIARKIGALGYSIAHTGNVRNFIFPFNRIPSSTEKMLADYGFRNIQQFSMGTA